ncbi:MAG: ATP-binding protein, partial [Reinekea sp.]|nr:ATP-binding protein [Reinekea sp.]
QIEDSGPGIEHDKLDTIFDPFVTTKGNGQGLGLGLSVVKDIVRDHHGKLTVARSDLGGANFQITLPRWPGSQGDANDT